MYAFRKSTCTIVVPRTERVTDRPFFSEPFNMENASRIPAQYASWRENSAQRSYAIVPEHSKPGSYREIAGRQRRAKRSGLRGAAKGKIFVVTEQLFEDFLLTQSGKCEFS